MKFCPICGDEITVTSYFDVRESQERKQAILHHNNTRCSLSNIPDYKYRAFNMDCLQGMNFLPDKSIDLILCDLPYGTTKCEWDKPLPFEVLWKQYERIIKDSGAIILFSQQPFTSELIMSNKKLFRYEIIWHKTNPTGFLNAKKMPLRIHENICVFYKRLPTYNPIMKKVERNDIGRIRVHKNGNAQQYNSYKTGNEYVETGERYPVDVINFSNWNGALFGNTDKATKHPTQKPIDLLEWLIKTYTNEGDTILDNCFGSGSTLVAALKCNRICTGFELDNKYYNIAANRLSEVK